MNIIFTIIAAPLIGWFVRSRPVASALYLAAVSVLFSFQTLAVFISWLAGETGFGGASDRGAFGPSPTGLPLDYDEGGVWSYGAVNLAVTLIGVGITVLLNALRTRRDRKRALREAVVAS